MIIADTSIWISYLRDFDTDLTEVFEAYLEKKDIYAVSAIFGELLQGAKSKREVNMLQGFWENLPKLKEENLFIKAGLKSNKYQLLNNGVGIVDSYILVACLENDFALWTLDKKLQRAYDSIINES